MSKTKSKIPEEVINEFTKPPNYRDLVRIASIDIRGDQPILFALSRIKGVGHNLARVILKRADIPNDKLVGFLDEEEIEKIEKILSDPVSYGIPAWMLNRQRDLDTGKDLHYIGSDLILRTRRDIEIMIRMKCWKGVRHSLGLKVRGQKTRTTGRKGLIASKRR
ncbi:MAG: 30S ribosomal protein S13 [Candidatus Njordarchaeia archaeon]|nr:30S ribosomal protein S13 [Candidatus Korarchaeota archaeon]